MMLLNLTYLFYLFFVGQQRIDAKTVTDSNFIQLVIHLKKCK